MKIVVLGVKIFAAVFALDMLVIGGIWFLGEISRWLDRASRRIGS